MNAKTTFIVAGVLAAAGIGLMGFSFISAENLNKLNRSLPKAVKDVGDKVNDDMFPSSKFIESEKDHEAALQAQNAQIWKKLERYRDALEDTFPGAPWNNPPRWAAARKEWIEGEGGLIERFANITAELEWNNEKTCPVPPLDGIPTEDQIPDLQAKCWIFETMLAAISAHTPGVELKDDQAVIVQSCAIAKVEEARGAAQKPYSEYTADLVGLIPMETLAGAINELISLDPKSESRNLLFALDNLVVKRIHGDPDRETEVEFEGDAPPAASTAPGLQAEVEVRFKIRKPKPFPQPPEE